MECLAKHKNTFIFSKEALTDQQAFLLLQHEKYSDKNRGVF
ncbi:hypothetical protein BD94_1168 [Elizabethkingia anophelis NUHP1]|uniref:Uncharacterized protein n=1 Tax=Elizabethkingia anophelis NUHP1 TaxID=1338011 RepID=A0A077EEA7_9FLAO|nr:hypothetical protein BD94_1168 [Elizabethkingia anophelis NUHP1]KMU62178.1 hypothetical protein EZBTHKR_2148 [Elizabethkingia anophelis]